MSEQQAINRNASMAVMAQLIFMSRWLQAPFYLGLIAAQGVYVFLFIKALSSLYY